MTRGVRQHSSPLHFHRYRSVAPRLLDFRDRQWPDVALVGAPSWCSVDLRDGNQALAQPMDPASKSRLFTALCQVGFKQIEVGFPSASETELAFVRMLIEDHLIPSDVTIQVLTQCRPELVEATVASLEGAPQAIVHFYNSTSPTQRRVVFGLDRSGIIDIATTTAAQLRDLADHLPGTDLYFEYSPESFTATEPDFALQICDEVLDVLEPSPDRPTIINLPATVECYRPNVYADVIEYMDNGLSRRESVILSIHPHNDRGTAVAAAELALLAGAQRVEGTLFGNGERTGNVDLVTVALNLFAEGVDPELDFTDLPALRTLAEELTGMDVPPRHPYAGDLVFTAFSGSHQDAIKKGLDTRDEGDQWDVPYLPVDPADLGRNYAGLIRVNSQSGKGGVAYILDATHGLTLPRPLQVAFARQVQRTAELTGREVSPAAIGELFASTYLEPAPHQPVLGDLRIDVVGETTTLTATLTRPEADGEPIPPAPCVISGSGNGPLAALAAALSDEYRCPLSITEYHEEALSEGSDATAVAYIALAVGDHDPTWGVAVSPSTLEAALTATLTALHRSLDPAPGTVSAS